MDLFTIASIIIVLSALFGYVNVKLLKLPNTIGMMIVAIGFTLVLFASALFTDKLLIFAEYLIGQIDFSAVLLEVMLGFLLFAGAMHTNFEQLKVQRWPVLAFSTLGVLASTFLIATISYLVFGLLGLQVKYIHCLLFGALISPTDPIAVLGILKKAGVPKKLETKIVGESLFNDGVGVVLFLTIFTIAGGSPHGSHDDHANPSRPGGQQAQFSVAGASSEFTQVGNHTVSSSPRQADSANATRRSSGVGQSTSPQVTDDPASEGHETSTADSHGHSTEEANGTTVMGVVQLFLQEVLGGILFGLVLGYITYWLLKSIDDYEVEVIITVACVMGGYSFAAWLHLSAPLAIVVAGLMVGNDRIRTSSMSEEVEHYVDQFWELMDMLMNAILFVLIGLELLILTIEGRYLLAAFLAIFIVLGCRFVSLLAPVAFFRKRLEFAPHTTTLMTWGGLRGGISIALALSLPADMNRDLILTVTYGVVVFSIIVQGLTVGKLAGKLIPGTNPN